MEINNVNSINKVDSAAQTKKKKEIQHDNTYQGEKVTTDTANPADILGRSMIVKREANQLIPPNASPDDIERIIKQKTKLDFSDIDMMELKRFIEKNPQKIKYLNKLLTVKNINPVEIAEILKDYDEKELENIDALKEVYTAINNIPFASATFSEIMSMGYTDEIKRIVYVIKLNSGLSMQKAAELIDKNIESSPELQEIVKSMPENMVNNVDYEDFEQFKLKKDFYPRLHFLSKVKNDNQRLDSDFINGFIRSDDTEKVEFAKKLLTQRLNVEGINGRPPETLFEALFSHTDFDGIDKEEIQKKLAVIEDFEKLKYIGADNEEHSLMQELYDKSGDLILVPLNSYSDPEKAEVFSKKLKMLSELSKIQKENPEYKDIIQEFFTKSARWFLESNKDIDYDINDLIKYNIARKKCEMNASYPRDKKELNKFLEKADLLLNAQIGGKPLIEVIPKDQLRNINVTSAKEIKEFIAQNEDKIIARDYDDWRQLINVIESKNPKKIEYLRDNVLGDAPNIPPEELGFEFETKSEYGCSTAFDDYMLYVDGLKDKDGKPLPYKTFGLDSSNLPLEKAKQKAKDAYFLAGTDLDSNTLSMLSINHTNVPIQDKVKVANRLKNYELDERTYQSLLLNFRADALEKLDLYDTDESLRKHSLKEVLKNKIDDLKLRDILEQDERINNLLGEKITKAMGLEYAKSRGEQIKIHNEKLMEYKYSSVLVDDLIRKYSDKPEIFEAVLNNNEMALQDLCNLVLGNFTPWCDKRMFSPIAKLVSVANEDNKYNLCRIISRLSSLQDDNAIENLDIDGVIKLVQTVKDNDTDTDTIEDIVHEHVWNGMSMTTFNKIYEELSKETINVKGQERPLNEYVPLSDVLELTKLMKNRDIDNLDNYISVVVDFIKQGEFGHTNIPDIVDCCMDKNGKIDQTILSKVHELSCAKLKEKLISDFVNAMKDENGIFSLDLYNDVVRAVTVSKLNKFDIEAMNDFIQYKGIEELTELPRNQKKHFATQLVKNNANLFAISDKIKKLIPLIPQNQEEYCTMLPEIVESLGIQLKPLDSAKIEKFHSDSMRLGVTLKGLSDEDFINLEIGQNFSKNDFIASVLEKVNKANLSKTELQKVYDYFGFELTENPKCSNEKFKNPTGHSIVGYPLYLHDEEKLADIKEPATLQLLEDIKGDVIKFTEKNYIYSNNPQVEAVLNEITEALPEMRSLIGKGQHETHDFDIFKHSLKVMQKIVQNPMFNKFNDSDKKVMLLASLLHDITKAEGVADPTHAHEGAFDTFFIAKKFNLSQDEAIKINTLIDKHEWLSYVNNASGDEKIKRMQSVAFDLQQGNLFEMAQIFTNADLEAIKKVPDGLIKGWQSDMHAAIPQIQKYIDELKTTNPLLPTTKFPTSSRVRDAITTVNDDGSTNIKGVYIKKDTDNGKELVVLKFNEVEDWEAIGFPKGSKTKGIFTKGITHKNHKDVSEDVETGNIKFFLHGLEYPNQLAKFGAFALPNSDALLSVTYAERPETKYRFFREQGVILDTIPDYIYGGGNTDAGSGYGKDIGEFKKNYIFGGKREEDRKFVSALIKEEFNMSDEEYVEFVEKNKGKLITEIEPIEVQERLIQKLGTITSNERHGDRSYNEMYLSNPKAVSAVFSYPHDDNTDTSNPVDYLEKQKDKNGFLQKYAINNDIPMIVFGD